MTKEENIVEEIDELVKKKKNKFNFFKYGVKRV